MHASRIGQRDFLLTFSPLSARNLARRARLFLGKISMSLTVVVLAMHRSGTSCVTRMLNLCGMDLGARLLDAPNISNMEGKWEAREAVEINERILAASGGAWDRVPARLEADEETRGRLSAFLGTLAASPVAGWKDPRTVLTFPLWRPLLGAYRIVACLRHPQSVAESLSEREGWPLDRGYDLWRSYNERLLAITQQEPDVLWFDFDLAPAELDRALRDACASLGLPYRAAALESFSTFQRHHQHHEPPAEPRLRALYEELRRRAHRYDAQFGGTAPAGITAPERCASEAGECGVPAATGQSDSVAAIEQQIQDLSRVVSKQNAIAQRSFKAIQQLPQRITELEARLTAALVTLDGARADRDQLRGELSAAAHRLNALESAAASLERLHEQQRHIERGHAELQGEFAMLAERTAQAAAAAAEAQQFVRRVRRNLLFRAVARVARAVRLSPATGAAAPPSGSLEMASGAREASRSLPPGAGSLSPACHGPHPPAAPGLHPLSGRAVRSDATADAVSDPREGKAA